MFSPEQWKQLLVNFLEEGRDLIQQAEEALLELDTEPGNTEALNALFRAVHTLKGSAGLFSLEDFVALVHQQEGLIMRVRDDNATLSREQVSLLLKGLDILRDEIQQLAEGGEPSALRTQHVEYYQQLFEQTQAGDPSANRAEAMPVAVIDDAGRLQREHPAVPTDGGWHISLRFAAELFEYGFEPASFVRYLGKLGQISHLQLIHDKLPSWPDYQPELCYLGLEITLISNASKPEIDETFDFIRELATIRILPPESKTQDYLQLIADLPEDKEMLGEILMHAGLLTERELTSWLAQQAESSAQQKLGQMLVDEGVVAPVMVNQALQKQAQIREKKHAESASIKVSAQKLDELINLVGELVIAAAGGEMLAKRHANSELLGAVSAINRHVEQIRESALRLRMVEIGDTFSRFQRVIRDVSQELGKKITLQVDGGETELDKSVVERISEPLTHLVRNALDHGIEMPEERLAAGKPEQGIVRLNAFHESGSIVIEVQDDGKGLDAKRIRQKAIDRGLMNDQVSMDDGALYQLIFEPGFSTAEAVSNLSGRGVGMDVVRRNVEALRGSIELDSKPGQGCCVRIRLPLTLAIIDGFLVTVGDTPLVIPLDMVTECLDADEGLFTSDDCYAYRELRGKPLPLINLRNHFDLEGGQAKRQNIVVVSHGKQQLGLVVDHLLGEQQIVIKPLGSIFSHLRDIGGSSILGSGQVALILDIAGMLQRMHDLDSHEIRCLSSQTNNEDGRAHHECF